MSAAAVRHLSKADPVMRALIRRVGPCGLAIRNQQPFETLVRAIAHQQIHGRAAEAILGRFLTLFPGRRFPAPAAVAAMDVRKMRRAGFSRGKIRAIKHIARAACAGGVPTRATCHRLTDEAIIERLIELHGVGQWTVEMLLIFTLGRPDVLPVDDLGIRKGAQVVDKLDEMPAPKALLARGEKWGPYRTYASLYLWRIADSA